MDWYFFPDLIHDFFVDFDFFKLFLFLFIIGFYVMISWILSDMNQLLYGKKSKVAWIPILNVYLMGALSLSKTVGYSLISGLILIILLNIFISSNIFITIISIIYLIILLISIIYVVYKYIDLKKSSKNNSMVTNTLDLGQDDLKPTKTNGPSESMINSINIIPTSNINNINSVPIQNTLISNNNINNNNSTEIQIPNLINNPELLNANNNNNLVQTNNSNIDSEKHYEMPKLILEASENSDKKENINSKNVNTEKIDDNLEEEKMKFVTGNDNISTSYKNSNMIPKEEITVVNGVINSSNETKTEEEQKMNIVSGTIIPNSNNINNQSNNSDSILDLNKKI